MKRRIGAIAAALLHHPCDPDLYIYHEPTRAQGEEFDDMVIWLSPHVLKNRMVQAMKLP